ncbi:PAS domain-containing sensor histidine kinase [Flavitalea flava]
MAVNDLIKPPYHQYLKGGGEMGELTRSFNWTETILGSPENWSQSLLTTISIMLNSRFPMFLWWGPDLIQFYNDAYRPSLGNGGKHPKALGQEGVKCWPEIWPVIKPLIDQVMSGGESTWSEDQLIPIYRNGMMEDVYWTFGYSKVIDETGLPAGVLVICNETTQQIKVMAELKASEEHFRLATRAAELGTFDMDLIKGTMDWDPRCRELFGISHQEKVTYENDFLPGLHEDDRERIETLINNLFNRSIGNGDYNVEYRTIGATDKKLRWLSAKGKVFFNEKDQPARFIGSVLEITDKKLDEQRKNDFIGMVSHELKTPLTSLKAYVQLLGDKAKDENDGFAVKALDRAEIQVNKMISMINGFLNISRLESGKIELKMQKFDLNAIIKEVINDITHFDASHSISFEIKETISVVADKDKIEHVVSNFLTNAIKYSPNGTAIGVKALVEGNLVCVSVKDEGIGIEDHDKEKLFERFYRVKRNDTQRVSGFGIGLYLSAEIIHRHKGKIWVQSENGRGSTFYFTLPVVQG